MDLIKSQKLKANRNRDHLIHNILVHLLTTLLCVFLCSYGFWLPQLISSANTFDFVSLPQWNPFLMNTKTLFLVVNLIVIILVGDSGALPNAHRRPLLLTSTMSMFSGAKGYEESALMASRKVIERRNKLRRFGLNRPRIKGLPAEEPTRSAAEDMQETKSDEGGESDELPTEELTRSAQEDLLGSKLDGGGESNKLPMEELTRRLC